MPGQQLIQPDVDPEWYREDAEARRLEELDALQASWDADNYGYNEADPASKAANGNDEADNTSSLEAAEAQAETDDGQNGANIATTQAEDDEFFEDDDSVEPRQLKITKARALFGGGLVVSLLAIFSGFGIMSGPASLVHLSKLLDRFHFANNEKFIDSRIGKLYKYARTLDAPERRTMSFVGNFVADRFTTRLVEAGITPKYSNELGKKGKLVAFEVNPSSEAGRQVLEEARARGITVSNDVLPGGSYRIEVGDEVNAAKRQLLGSITGIAEDNKYVAAISKRFLSKRSAITRFHPFRDLKATVDEKYGDLVRKIFNERERARRLGATDPTIDTSKSANAPESAKKIDDSAVRAEGEEIFDGTTKAAAQNITDPIAEATSQAGRVGRASAAFKNGVKKAAGPTAIVALFCGLDKLGDSIPKLRYLNIALPLMRIGMEVISAGSQIITGQNINFQEVGILASELNSTLDSEGGSAFGAASIQANLGNDPAGRIDIAEGDKPITKKKPLVFEVISQMLATVPGSGFVCDAITTTIGSILVTGLDLFAAFATGSVSSIATSVGANIGGYAASEVFKDDIAKWASGDPLNVMTRGAMKGAYADYGARLAANDVCISRGCVPLTDQQSAALKRESIKEDNIAMKHSSVFERYFSINNDRSLLSKVAFEQPNFSSPKNLAMTALKGPLVAFNNISKGLSGQAMAATSYDYGFPEYGFSKEDMDNPDYDDPYQNIINAQNYHDDEYGDGIDGLNNKYGQACFGLTIDPTTLIPQTGPSVKDTTEIPEMCRDPNDRNLKIYRFLIADGSVMNSIKCGRMNDEPTCEQFGFSSAGDLGGSSTIVDCGSAQGNGKIVCAAQNYSGIRYAHISLGTGQNILRGGGNADAWLKQANSDIATLRSTSYVECSGFANLSLWAAFQYKTKNGCSKDYATNTDPNIKSIISPSDVSSGKKLTVDMLQAGDFLTISNSCNTAGSPGHVGIFVKNNGDGTFTTLESSGGTNAQGKVESGFYVKKLSTLGGTGAHDFKYAGRYIGPGSGSP